MKRLIVYIPFLLFACTAKTDNISSVSLPYKEAGTNLVDSIIRQIKWRDLTLQIKFETKDRFVFEDSPFLFSMDKNGKIIDSLKLFRRQPYYPSNYTPWFEINKAGIITTTDTAIQNVYRPSANKNNEKYQVLEMYVDTFIRIYKFKINTSGRFSRIE